MTKSRASGCRDPVSPPALTGAELKERRLRLGLSQVAFGKLLGVSRYTIARSENGIPSENVVIRMAYHIKNRRPK
jgi:transcriptional regulator with XRE-family HTH domain